VSAVARADVGRWMSSIGPVLQQIARTTAATVGFRTAVINLHRPAWDDFETVVVHGSDEARAVLLGQTTTRADWEPLLDERFERRGAYFIENGAFDWSADGLRSYIPAIDGGSGPDAWHPEDGLFVPLIAATGDVLGILSVDEPHDGRRPSDHQLDVLVGAASHAALAIELGQEAATATRQRAAVEHLLRVSTELNERHSVEEMLEFVCVGIRDALGFEKVVAFLIRDGDKLVPGASAGLEPADAASVSALPLAGFERLLEPALERDGVVLLENDVAWSLSPGAVPHVYSSRRNGVGPLAWDHHWLMVPLRDREGRLEGLLWADEPADRLLPTREKRHALRAFANQAVSAMASARQLAAQRHLAEHDPLTGLRNRRGLLEHIDAEIAREAGPVAVLVCDLDHFKRINDVLGYATGDAALCRAASVIAGIADPLEPNGLAARLGGEEFALVLPGHDEAAAIRVAERVRLSVARASEDFPRALTASIGVAVSGEGAGAAALLRDATRACVGAKRLGRDRSIPYHAATLDALLGASDGTSVAGEQLDAAMLLAETLDVRDGGTARHSHTVGRYAGDIARALGLDEGRAERIRAAGVLHDIGKLGVADAILKKPGTLTVEEWEEMRRHSELGARILAHANLPDISAWVLAHHERLDGHGYPHGLAGEAIPLESRILAVADAYEAMTADRAYRMAMSSEAAQAELRAASGGQFDPDVVEAFLRVLGAARDSSVADADSSVGDADSPAADAHSSAGVEGVLCISQDRGAWTPQSRPVVPPPRPKPSFAPASSS
jgi:diguanylate cyclase (GGDEF)-like protein/putative nucleotidyltransferase with HDIG domain